MTTNTEVDLTHWIYRLIAYVIDFVIIYIPAIIISIILAFATAFISGFFGGVAFMAYLLSGVLLFLYFSVLDVMWGGTIGKRIFGLHVQTVNGGRITYGQSIVRNISKFFGPILLLDWLLGVILQGDKRQKFTDRIANTVVVKQAAQSVPPPPPPPPPP
ncbi:MAG: RDD family protein [Candidatus Bathyarchaeota archaeon]|nr:RDD family protein [Candidatus Bathyarchaeota archaeon]